MTKINNDVDTIVVPDVSYNNIIKQKRVLEKLVLKKSVTNKELKELEGTLNLLDFMQDEHRKTYVDKNESKIQPIIRK